MMSPPCLNQNKEGTKAITLTVVGERDRDREVLAPSLELETTPHSPLALPDR